MYIHVHNYGAQSGQVVELASYYMYTLSQLAGWLHPYKYCLLFSQGERGTHALTISLLAITPVKL